MGAEGAEGLGSVPSGLNIEDASNDEDVNTKDGQIRDNHCLQLWKKIIEVMACYISLT